MRQRSLALEAPKDVAPQFPARVMAGVRPEGCGVHVSHYFGTVRPLMRLQREYPGETFCVIADYHELAVDSRCTWSLTGSARAVARDYLALGFDPNVSTIYRQSDVPQVCELMWILSCCVRKSNLEKAYVRRAASLARDPGSLGLFAYPALVAADMLALRATEVPLVLDLAPMLETVRETARTFNRRWGAIFPLPYLREPAIPALRGTDGRPMSAAFANELPVFWSSDEDLADRVTHMVTDCARLGEPIDPDSSALFQLYRLVADRERSDEMRRGFASGGLGYRDAKRLLLEAFHRYFEPYHERIRELHAEPSLIEEVLLEGSHRAREEADRTLEAVREALGLPTYHRSVQLVSGAT